MIQETTKFYLKHVTSQNFSASGGLSLPVLHNGASPLDPVDIARKWDACLHRRIALVFMINVNKVQTTDVSLLPKIRC